MKYFTAKDAKNQFGRMLDASQAGPVLVSKHGRPVAVLMSFEEYERLGEIEKAYWAGEAAAADDDGYIGRAASESLIARDIAAGG